MITILPADKPYIEDGFDLLTDDDGFLDAHLGPALDKAEIKKGKWNPVGLPWLDHNPYRAAKVLLGDALDTVQQVSAYECPYLNQKFQSVVPLVLLTKDLAKNYPDFKHFNFDMLNDRNWNLHYFTPNLGSFEKAMMGPGYTEFFLPSDGIRDDDRATIKLSNGDLLYVAVWQWFNK
jgi:hypothetical protein